MTYVRVVRRWSARIPVPLQVWYCGRCFGGNHLALPLIVSAAIDSGQSVDPYPTEGLSACHLLCDDPRREVGSGSLVTRADRKFIAAHLFSCEQFRGRCVIPNELTNDVEEPLCDVLEDIDIHSREKIDPSFGGGRNHDAA